MSKETKKQSILHDLLKGVRIDMLSNLERYGTACRSRIAELRADGYPIQDEFKKTPSGARYKVYFLPASYFAKSEVA